MSVTESDDHGRAVVNVRTADVGVSRESRRRRRLWTLALVVGIPTVFLWARIVDGRPFNIFALPDVDPLLLMPALFFLALILAAGRHHRRRRPLAARRLPTRADRRPPRRRHRDRRGQGGRRPLAEPLPRAQGLPRGHGRHAAARPAVRGRPRDRQDLPRQGHGRRGGRPLLLRVGHVVPVDVLRRHGPQDPFLLQGSPQGRPRRGRRDRLHRGDRRHRHGARRGVGHDDAGRRAGHRPAVLRRAHRPAVGVRRGRRRRVCPTRPPCPTP